METLGLLDDESTSKSRETVMLMPEYLIVCCWRSVKEISLLLGQLTACVPIVGTDAIHGLLTYDQVSVLGQLMSCVPIVVTKSTHGMLRYDQVSVLGQLPTCVPVVGTDTSHGLLTRTVVHQ